MLMTGISAVCVGFLSFSFAIGSKYSVVSSYTLVAFTLGLRHGFDCDHLAAIDNVTRQLLFYGQRPVSVGFWFALGHSTVVLLLTIVVAGGYAWASAFSNNFTTWISELAAGFAIILLGSIGCFNAYIAVNLFKHWSALQRLPEHVRDREITNAGDRALQTALSSLPGVKKLFSYVNRPYKMYNVGFVFGLTFDSATQVALIGMAAVLSHHGMPLFTVLLFPAAFSCGMCLVDAFNGILMLVAYTVSSDKPSDMLLYNIIVTSISAGLALFICTLEALQIVAKRAQWSSPFWLRVQHVDMLFIGYSIVFTFALILVAGWCYAKGCCCGKRRGPRDNLCII